MSWYWGCLNAIKKVLLCYYVFNFSKYLSSIFCPLQYLLLPIYLGFNKTYLHVLAKYLPKFSQTLDRLIHKTKGMLTKRKKIPKCLCSVWMSEQLFLEINVSEKDRLSSSWCWSCAKLDLLALKMARWVSWLFPATIVKAFMLASIKLETIRAIYLGTVLPTSMSWYVQCVASLAEETGLPRIWRRMQYSTTLLPQTPAKPPARLPEKTKAGTGRMKKHLL